VHYDSVLTVRPGGKGANQAAAAGLLGADVTMIGASGRVYIAGTSDGVGRARTAIENLLASLEGRGP